MSPKREPTRDPEIFRYPDGTYYYRGTPEGSKSTKERSLKTKIFKEAKINKNRLKAKYESLGGAVARNLVKGLFVKYMADREVDLKKGYIRKSTFDETATLIRAHLNPFFGKFTIDEIDNPLFQKYMRAKKERLDFSNHRKVLGHFLRWARDEKLIRYAPELTIPNRYKSERRARIILTEPELTRLLNNAKGDLFLFVAMYLFMGMRRSEIIKLSWDRVDLERKTITLQAVHTKTKKSREVPINPTVHELLKIKFLKATNKSWVFPSPRKGTRDPHLSVSGFRRGWARLLVESEIVRKITPHDLRATWEKYTHGDPAFTDTQREKMAGASIDVQKRIYVSMTADDYRGLAEAVKFDGMDKILAQKVPATWGNSWGESAKKKGSKRAKR